jgi:hypothetical protein
MADKKGAWTNDRKFGLRLDQTFELNEPFVVLGGKVSPDPIETDIGPAVHTKLVVQRMDEKGHATGRIFEVGTLASAIAGKIEDSTPADFPAIVVLQKVPTKKGNDALVLTLAGEADPSALLDEYSIDGDALKRADQLRAPADRMELGD